MAFDDFFKRAKSLATKAKAFGSTAARRGAQARDFAIRGASTVRNTARRGAATVRSVSARCSANNKRMKVRIAEEKRRFKNAARLHSDYEPSSSLLSNVNYLDARNYGNRRRK